MSRHTDLSRRCTIQRGSRPRCSGQTPEREERKTPGSERYPGKRHLRYWQRNWGLFGKRDYLMRKAIQGLLYQWVRPAHLLDTAGHFRPFCRPGARWISPLVVVRGQNATIPNTSMVNCGTGPSLLPLIHQGTVSPSPLDTTQMPQQVSRVP